VFQQTMDNSEVFPYLLDGGGEIQQRYVRFYMA
jgi:hypothetical protein